MMIIPLAVAISCAGIAITWAIKKHRKSKMDERSKNIEPKSAKETKPDSGTLTDKSKDNGASNMFPLVEETVEAEVCNDARPSSVNGESDKLKLFINYYGKMITIEVKPNAIIKNVKKEIEIQLGIPEKKMLLIINGKQLENDDTISDSHCQDLFLIITDSDLCKENREYKKKVFLSICENLVDEPNKEVLLGKLHLLVVCMKTFGAKIFDPDVKAEIVRILKQVFKIHEKNNKERLKRKDDEEKEMDIKYSQDDQLLNKIYDILHTLLIVNEYGFYVYFDEVIKGPVKELLTPKEAWQDQLFGLRIVNEVIEAVGLEWDKWYCDKDKIFINMIIEKMIQIIDSRPPAVVLEAAFRGIGLLGLHQGAIIKKYQSFPEFLKEIHFKDLKSSKLFQNLKKAVPRLEKFIEKQYSEDLEFLCVRWNASLTLQILRRELQIEEQVNTNVFVK
ncbi:hypothetical protein QYM36_010363 [Artemia franciscana]|uniref:Ubiquitin-like domain-containing protein n=1 Tax=Artemia franciscana TaxID=6661 RepID=A0AA88HTZ2_ARTSF|nr:hypothetical protein QYM36_010363 [Artemia franciscana]